MLPSAPASKPNSRTRRAKKKRPRSGHPKAEAVRQESEQFGRSVEEEKPAKEDYWESTAKKPATLQDIEIELRAVSQGWDVPKEVQPAVIATLVKAMTGGSTESVKLKSAIALMRLVRTREQGLQQQAMLLLRKKALGIEDAQQAVVLEGSAKDSTEAFRSLIRGCQTREELAVVKAMLFREGLLEDE